MQESIDFDAGHGGYGLHLSDHTIGPGSQPGSNSQQSSDFSAITETPGQSSHYLQSPSTNLDILVFNLNFGEQESATFRNIITPASQVLLDSILLLSKCEQQTFSCFCILGQHGSPQQSIKGLAPSLELIPRPMWALLHGLDHGRRLLLASYLEERHRPIPIDFQQTFGRDHHAQRIRSNSQSQSATLSPAPGDFSAPSPSPSCSTTDKFRFHCPGTDCNHKPQGYTKRGYLVNHIKTHHPTWIDEHSDWEDRLDAPFLGVDSRKRRRSRSVNESSSKRRICTNPFVEESSRDKSMAPDVTTPDLGANLSYNDYAANDFEIDNVASSSQNHHGLPNNHLQPAFDLSQLQHVPTYAPTEDAPWTDGDFEGTNLRASTTPTIRLIPPRPQLLSIQTQPAPVFGSSVFGGSPLDPRHVEDYPNLGLRRSSAPSSDFYQNAKTFRQ